MTPITVGLKDEVAWIEDNMFDERPEHLKIKNTINGQGQQWPCFFTRPLIPAIYLECESGLLEL